MRLLHVAAIALACGTAAYALPPAYAGWGHKPNFERFCSDDAGKKEKMAEWQTRRADRLAERLKLTDAQKAAFKELQDARAKAREDGRAAICAAKPDLSKFETRIEFREAAMQRRLDTLKALAPKLIAFRNSLDDKQKEEFDPIVNRMLGGGGHRFGHHHGGGMGHWGHRHDD